MAELLELREAVQKAEDATARRRPNQRYRETVSAAYRAQHWKRAAVEASPRQQARQSDFGWGFQINLIRRPLRSAYSKRHEENKSSPRQIVHAVAVAMKKLTAVFWRQGCPQMIADVRPSLWKRAKAIKNERFLSDFFGVGMRIPGAALLILGFGLCFVIDDWEFVGLVPMAIGLMLLAIAEKKASALALAQAASFAQMEKQAPRASRNSCRQQTKLS